MLNNAGVAPRIAQEAMRHSDIRLTQSYMDSDQIDVVGAVESLPSWALANALNSSWALAHAPTTGTERQELAHNGTLPEAPAPDEETKKPLENVDSPRVSNVGVIGHQLNFFLEVSLSCKHRNLKSAAILWHCWRDPFAGRRLCG